MLIRNYFPILLFIFLGLFSYKSIAQCTTCGNGVINVGETNFNCPQDIPHGSTCTSPCGQPTSSESAAGLRIAEDFTGNTTYGATALPGGWTFASAPTATTAGALASLGTDTYGAKAGTVQPGCSGSCAGTNGFCIGNIASNTAVGAGGSGGKLGANFDGRANVASNLSYAVLRGQGNPTLVSPNYNVSSVQGFKIQFWLAASESSCGQANAWGSCVGNTTFLDFSADGGATWTQIMQMNTSSTSSDMCTNNSTNTFWFTEGRWSRVCITVFKNATSPGNYYPASSSTTAASGIMVNSAYFTSTFKYRIRYSQTASCTSGISATNPGRYLAIDYPVFTSGNEMIPCGISFTNMCGYGQDNNDDGVGSSTLTTNSTVFGTVKSSVNHAERGVEIFSSQNATFGNQNITGSNFTTNFDLCNAEGGDKQCIDWQSNNNSYFVVYECIADWEAASGGGSNGINVQYYKNGVAQSTGMSKVTAVGKTALIGWRYSANRFVNCSNTSDLNPGCNGYSFSTGSLPLQFVRAFYHLATNSMGQSWSFYGASSCNHYFKGPNFAPIAVPNEVNVGSNFLACTPPDLFFEAMVDYCSTSTGFTGSANVNVSGPGGFSESISSGSTGTTVISTPGDYTISANTPSSPTQCLNCSRSVCVTVTQADIDNCIALPVTLMDFYGEIQHGRSYLYWTTQSEQNSSHFEIERSYDGIAFAKIGQVQASINSSSMISYDFEDVVESQNNLYYRLSMIDLDGKKRSSNTIALKVKHNSLRVVPNPSNGNFILSGVEQNSYIQIIDTKGNTIYSTKIEGDNQEINLHGYNGIFFIKINSSSQTNYVKFSLQ